MTTNQFIQCQGRTLSDADIRAIQELIDEHPLWKRSRVYREVCHQWDWRTDQGILKTFAAREMLLKLEQRVGLRLPPIQENMRRRPWGIPEDLPPLPPPPPVIQTPLKQLQPLHWQIADAGSFLRKRALGYLRQYHYLGCNRPVGTHLFYVVSDRFGRELAVHLIGAAAWQCADRDRFIGWSPAERSTHLSKIGNHSRYLILPWVKVSQLASHLLVQLVRRIRTDWPARHGRPLVLLESFVEIGRFKGTAYRAADWKRLGQTTGRTRQEKHHRPQKPPKAIWVYPLVKNFRAQLGVQG